MFIFSPFCIINVPNFNVANNKRTENASTLNVPFYPVTPHTKRFLRISAIGLKWRTSVSCKSRHT